MGRKRKAFKKIKRALTNVLGQDLPDMIKAFLPICT
jgi:hypothetical protein